MSLKLQRDYSKKLEMDLWEEICRQLRRAASSPVPMADPHEGDIRFLDVKEISEDRYSELGLLAGELARIAVRQFGSMCEAHVAQQEAERKKDLNARFFA